MIAFAHDFGVSVGRVDPGVILIEPKQHYVVLFDWSESVTFQEGNVPAEARREEIAEAAKAVIELLGGDLESHAIPCDDKEEHERCKPYIDFLFELAAGGQRDAMEAHSQFYKLVDALWERAYYPFTSYPLEEK